MNTEEIIKDYIETYKVYWKTIPAVEKKGAWIYVNGDAFRAKHIKELTLEMKKELKEEENDEDIRELISAIRQDGKHIFMSTDLKKMQQAGKRIAKMAKRILNTLGEE